MELAPLRDDLRKFLRKRNLVKKWEKAEKLFQANVRYPSLSVELLEPRWRGIYSFRLDKKYRALFFVKDSVAEIFQITKHYRKG